jgi:hypothetical protein
MEISCAELMIDRSAPHNRRSREDDIAAGPGQSLDGLARLEVIGRKLALLCLLDRPGTKRRESRIHVIFLPSPPTGRQGFDYDLAT